MVGTSSIVAGTLFVGTSVDISEVFPDCLNTFGDEIRSVDLFATSMNNYYAILRMDWLERHQATIDCKARMVIFDGVKNLDFVFQASRARRAVKLISALKVIKLMSKGREGYLAFVNDTSVGETHIQDVAIVRDFLDVFLKSCRGVRYNWKRSFLLTLFLMGSLSLRNHIGWRLGVTGVGRAVAGVA